jgi:hypothetical protein
MSAFLQLPLTQKYEKVFIFRESTRKTHHGRITYLENEEGSEGTEKNECIA